MTYTMHNAVPLQSTTSLKKTCHTRTHWYDLLHYIFMQILQKLCIYQLPMSGSKQNKEPEPQQSTAGTPTAVWQENPMTVMKFDL